ncbi:MAG: hypothetical protein M3066_14570 [Actinomycetota bacterium]|nr:hypothetical protein [Actinomycetota bacterium]
MALAVRPAAGADLGQALRAMGLTTGVPTIVLVGGGATRAQLDRLGPLLEKVVIPVTLETGGAVVDEGDAGGVGARLGEASRAKQAQFPLVGVAAEHQAGSGDGLDSNHTHFVVVPADRPGWAARWTSSVASALAGGHGSVALLTGGGDAAWRSVAAQVADGRRVLAVARTGGAADHLAAAARGNSADSRAGPLVASGQVLVADPSRGAAHLAEVLRQALDPPPAGGRPAALGPGPGLR